MYRSDIAVVAAVNNDQLLVANLMQSPMIACGRLPVIIERGYSCASAAYNAGMRDTDAEYVVFAHQDVFFPLGWERRLRMAIAVLEAGKVPWAVLGVWGVRANGQFAGRVWCVGSNAEFSGPVHQVQEVVSIDEIVIVVKRSTGLSFDEDLPHFHMYATDLIQTARQRGLGAYVFEGPVVHNSHWDPQLDSGYFDAYRYMQRKWAALLPLRTCVLPISRCGWRPRYRWMKVEARRILGRLSRHPRVESPAELASRLGYDVFEPKCGDEYGIDARGSRHAGLVADDQ